MRNKLANILLPCALSVASVFAEGELNEAQMTQAKTLQKEIPILAWWGIPSTEATLERYREMADAGFTHALPPESDSAVTRRHLDLAAKAGVKLIIQDDRMGTPGAVAGEFKSHPGLGGYHLQDEPSATRFPILAKLVEQLRKEDPEHFAYINLLPNYATPEQLGSEGYKIHLDDFMKIVHPAFVSYDNYGIVGNGGRKGIYTPRYFENLEVVREGSLKQGLPFWAFAMVTPHNLYVTPLESDIRFQVFNSLAYGARGIQYFTYWTPVDRPDSVFYGGPIDENGRKTPTWDHIKTVNAEVKALTPTLLKLRSVGVFHSEPLPPGTSNAIADRRVRNIEGDPVVVGFFTDDLNRLWLFVVNRSFRKSGQVEIMLAETPEDIWEVDKSSGEMTRENFEKNAKISIKLLPGEGRLIGFR